MLDRQGGDLDVGDVLAAQARCGGELGRDRRVPRAGRNDPDGRLRQIRGDVGPGVPNGEGLLAERPGVAREANQRVEDRPAEGDSSLAVGERIRPRG